MGGTFTKNHQKNTSHNKKEGKKEKKKETIDPRCQVEAKGRDDNRGTCRSHLGTAQAQGHHEANPWFSGASSFLAICGLVTKHITLWVASRRVNVHGEHQGFM